MTFRTILKICFSESPQKVCFSESPECGDAFNIQNMCKRRMEIILERFEVKIDGNSWKNRSILHIGREVFCMGSIYGKKNDFRPENVLEKKTRIQRFQNRCPAHRSTTINHYH